MITTIHVHQHHIKEGTQSEPCLCALALAFLDVLKIGATVAIAGDVEICLGDFRYCAELPEAACKFRDAFDLGLSSARPFSFEMELPEEVLR